MNIIERINELRTYMKSEAVDITIIPTSDFHDSEYVSDYFKVREYFSGFTGSAGTLIVSMDEVVLYTDSRYFVQAKMELKDTPIKLMKMQVEGVPTIEEYIRSKLSKGMSLGFDGRVITALFGAKLLDALREKEVLVNTKFDPASCIKERPSMVFNPISLLDNKYTGEDAKDKLNKVYERMKKEKSDSYIIQSLDDIAYLLNMRGNDVECNPVFFSYLVLFNKNGVLYANPCAEQKRDIEEYLGNIGIELQPYENFYEDALERVKNCTKQGLLFDTSRGSFAIYEAVQELKLCKLDSPIAAMKSVKNKVEQDNILKANIKDGVALVRFNRWLKEAIDSGEELTEIIIQDKLYEFRVGNDTMMGPSFPTICAYGEHGAIVHYESDESGDVKVNRGSFLLIDSGCQYLEGTTDITRTYAIGEVDDRLKKDYTMVLRAHLKLMNAQFKKGVRGSQLDMIPKSIFWEKGVDYGHGTGHGIGCYLNVHESPVRISWPIIEGRPLSVVFEEGMLVSDEPGFYLEGQYGIRIENDLMCENRVKNEYGQFLGFRPMTLCPYDMSAILWDDMDDKDISFINEYHSYVYKKLSPFLKGEDLEYLKESTKAYVGNKE